MRTSRAIAGLAAALGLFLAGCEGSNPGRGTRTLHVEALAYSEGTRDSSRFFVVVREGGSGGQQLTDEVTVRIRGREEGEWTLPFEGIAWGNFVAGGHHRTGIDWQRGFHIEVRRNDESWLEAYLEFPGHTRIVAPVSGTAHRIDRGLPLDVQWEYEGNRRAQSVRVTLNRNDYDVELDEDARRHEIPTDVFRRTGSERVSVYRATEIDLEGGARGSYFQATSRHRIEFEVE